MNAPETAPAPGQAAYEAAHAAPSPLVLIADWETLPVQWRDAWQRAAEAAIWAANGAHVPGLAAQERPAPELAKEVLKHADPDEWDTDDGANAVDYVRRLEADNDRLRELLNEARIAEPQPATELAAAALPPDPSADELRLAAEADEARATLAGLTDAMHALASTLSTEADDSHGGLADGLRDAAQRISEELGHHQGLPPALTPVEAVRIAVAEEWQPRVDEALARLAVSETERDGLRQALDKLREQHKVLLDQVLPAGSGYAYRTSGVMLARKYARAGLPVRDDIAHLAGQ